MGPQVLYHLPEYDVMVLEFLEGETMSNEQLDAPGMPTRIAQSIKRLHAGPRFLTDFNMFRLTEYYLKICDEYEVIIPTAIWIACRPCSRSKKPCGASAADRSLQQRPAGRELHRRWKAYCA